MPEIHSREDSFDNAFEAIRKGTSEDLIDPNELACRFEKLRMLDRALLLQMKNFVLERITADIFSGNPQSILKFELYADPSEDITQVQLVLNVSSQFSEEGVDLMRDLDYVKEVVLMDENEAGRLFVIYIDASKISKKKENSRLEFVRTEESTKKLNGRNREGGDFKCFVDGLCEADLQGEALDDEIIPDLSKQIKLRANMMLLDVSAIKKRENFELEMLSFIGDLNSHRELFVFIWNFSDILFENSGAQVKKFYKGKEKFRDFLEKLLLVVLFKDFNHDLFSVADRLFLRQGLYGKFIALIIEKAEKIKKRNIDSLFECEIKGLCSKHGIA